MRLALCALATLGAFLYWRSTPAPAAAPLVAVDAWAHNLAALERHCERTAETWDQIAAGRFRQTVEYDDVEAHKVCQHARGLGCAHGPCRHPVLPRGCLNSRRDMCCDRDHKRCRKIILPDM